MRLGQEIKLYQRHFQQKYLCSIKETYNHILKLNKFYKYIKTARSNNFKFPLSFFRIIDFLNKTIKRFPLFYVDNDLKKKGMLCQKTILTN